MQLIIPSLIPRYQETHRHYHTLTHISEMFAAYIRYIGSWPDLNEFEEDWLRKAIWYHDAIYDPRQHDNEEQSALLAADELSGLLTRPQQLTIVTDLVRSTMTHAANNDLARVLSDLDLWIFGAPIARYEQYTRQVRQEYEFVEYPVYIQARIGILRNFLERENIYYYLTELEETARFHVEREITQLEEYAHYLGPVITEKK